MDVSLSLTHDCNLRCRYCYAGAKRSASVKLRPTVTTNATLLNFIDTKIITSLKNGYECRDRCNFGEREITIAPSGRIYPCERLIGPDTDPALSIGNVFTGFDEDISLGAHS